MPARDDEVQALVEPLSAELHRSVLVDDAGLRLLAYSPTQGSDDDVRKTAILTRETPRAIRDLHFSQGIATATEAVRTASRPEFGLQSRVCVPIRCQGMLFAYLWLIDADESLTGEDCELAERCAAEIGAAMYRREELEKPRRELERRALDALLGADPAQREQAARALVGEDLLVRAASACLRCRPEGRGAGAGREGAARARARPVPPRAAARHSLSAVRGDHGLVLVALDSRAAGCDIARRLHEALETVLGYTEPCEHLADAHAPTSTRGWP